MAIVSALVSGLDAELRRLGYKDSTMVWYRGCWRRMERFFDARGVLSIPRKRGGLRYAAVGLLASAINRS
jgi:hypothetical protein